MIQTELDKYTVTYQTSHYVFHCRPHSMAHRDLERIAIYQEKWFERITGLLQVMPQGRLQYYLTNNAEDAGLIYGDGEPCNGFASKPDTVVATYNEDVFCLGGHEDTHLIALQIGEPDSVFLREGLAMWVDGQWWGRNNLWWVKQFLHDKRYISVQTLLDDEFFYEFDSAITYPIAGTFTLFMMETLGLQQYLAQIYSTKHASRLALTQAFGRELEEIDNAFVDWIQQQNLQEKVPELIAF